jgi:hypothetical protein
LTSDNVRQSCYIAAASVKNQLFTGLKELANPFLPDAHEAGPGGTWPLPVVWSLVLGAFHFAKIWFIVRS